MAIVPFDTFCEDIFLTASNFDSLADSFALPLEREVVALDPLRALGASELARMAMRLAVVPRKEKRRSLNITHRQSVPP